jgi:hypothetical protein
MNREGTEIQIKGSNNLFNEIVEENLPNLGKEMVIQIHEVFRNPNRQDQKRLSPCHAMLKMKEYRTKEEYKKLQDRSAMLLTMAHLSE